MKGKIYLVIANTYTEDYRTQLELLLVTENKDEAIVKALKAEERGWEVTIKTVELGKDVRLELGGYIE